MTEPETDQNLGDGASLMEHHIEQVAGRALLETRKSLSLQDVLASYANRIGTG